MIKAEIVAHSVNPQGDELISVLCTFPRIILAEVNTHRMLSKNTSSSRAIPFKKMLQAIEENPFIPIAWQKDHSGMQGTEYITDGKTLYEKTMLWLGARNEAVKHSTMLNKERVDDNISPVTKQICNRLLEPFMWTTMLITGSKEGWDNFFYLRCPKYSLFSENMPLEFRSKKDFLEYVRRVEAPEFRNQYDNLTELDWLQINKGQAEIHIMAVAEAMWDALNESTPKELKAGEWHIPFGDKTKDPTTMNQHLGYTCGAKEWLENRVKISVAMAARTSYTVVGDEKEIDYKKMIELHDRLLNQEPPHSSPFEHVARCMSNIEREEFVKGKQCRSAGATWADLSIQGWCYNLKGFIPYRYLVDNKIEI